MSRIRNDNKLKQQLIFSFMKFLGEGKRGGLRKRLKQKILKKYVYEDPPITNREVLREAKRRLRNMSKARRKKSDSFYSPWLSRAVSLFTGGFKAGRSKEVRKLLSTGEGDKDAILRGVVRKIMKKERKRVARERAILKARYKKKKDEIELGKTRLDATLQAVLKRVLQLKKVGRLKKGSRLEATLKKRILNQNVLKTKRKINKGDAKVKSFFHLIKELEKKKFLKKKRKKRPKLRTGKMKNIKRKLLGR